MFSRRLHLCCMRVGCKSKLLHLLFKVTEAMHSEPACLFFYYGLFQCTFTLLSILYIVPLNLSHTHTLSHNCFVNLTLFLLDSFIFFFSLAHALGCLNRSIHPRPRNSPGEAIKISSADTRGASPLIIQLFYDFVLFF